MHPQWAVNWPDPLSASHSFPLFVPMPCSAVSLGSPHYFSIFSSLHVCFSLCLPPSSCHILVFPSCVFLFISPFLLQFLYVICLPILPSITVFPAALLSSYQIKWSLPMGNMINRLHFTRYQESRFHLPSTSMGTQPFNSSSARTAGGNPPGHLHWHLIQKTKTWAINLETSTCQL